MFYSRLQSPEVILPVLSLKFFADVCLAYEWLDLNGYEMASPTIYMKLIKYNLPARFPGGKYPSLLKAIGIPDDARKNQNVEERYYEAFNHVRTFILLHELGHIFYRHDNSVKSSQEKEIEADRFALEAFLRIQSPPAGPAVYFAIAANLQLNRSDFSNEVDWKSYVSHLSHPANEQRLEKASEFIREHVAEFAGGESVNHETRALVLDMANSIEQLAKLVATSKSEMVPAKEKLVDMAPLTLRKRSDSKGVSQPKH